MKVDIPGQGWIIARYGAEAQTTIHMEECAELIQAISKMRRAHAADRDDSKAYDNLVEEMADVLICMEQIKEIYGINTCEIQDMINTKCLRQEARMYDPY